MQEITSKDNAVFKYAAKLKDKRFRADEGQYLAEGERLVLDLIAYGFSGDIAFILVEKSIYDRHSTEFAAVKTYIITEKLAGILADTENYIFSAWSLCHFHKECSSEVISALQRRNVFI